MKNVKPFITAFIVALVAALALAPAYSQEKSPEKSQDKSGEQDQVIRENSTLVNVPVTVTDTYGRFVKGIRQADFTVRENGVPQRIDDFSDTEVPFNVALLIDLSRSTQTKLPEIKKAASAFVRQLQPRDRVLIVAFDEQVRFVGEFSNSQKDLEHAINSLKSSYSTSLYDAISQTINEKLLPIQGRKAIVLLTDGVDTGSRRATYDSTLELISRSGIVCYAIQYETRNEGRRAIKPSELPPGLGSSPYSHNLLAQSQTGAAQSEPTVVAPPQPPVRIPSNINSGPQTPASTGSRQFPGAQISRPRDRNLIAMEFLRSAAFQSGARYLRSESIESATYSFLLIAEELRHLYTIAYYSTNDKRDGSYRSIGVTLNRNDYAVRARQGYFAPREESAGAAKPEK